MTGEVKKNKFCNTRRIISGLGIFCIAFGLPFAIFWPDIFENILAKNLQISPTFKGYRGWKEPSLTLYMDIYLYNWTNPEDFTNHSTKPIFEQLGPYRFREYPNKMNLEWHPDNSTVSYKQTSTFYFDVEGSKGSLDDMVTSVNLVSTGAVNKNRFAGFFDKKKTNIGLNMYEQQVTVTKSANELLFEGYEDDMVTMGRMVSSEHIPYDKIGWFYLRNGTVEMSKVFNVHTGALDMSQFGKIQSVDGKSKSEAFEGKCNDLYGSTGEFHPMGQTRDSPISLLTSDMCRTIELDYEEDIDVRGLKAYKYVAGERTFDNGSKYPEMACYCNGDCMPSGVFNLTNCRYGSPVFMSLPHYLHADPFYANQVEGLNATKDKHEFYIAVEPTTGIPVKVAARLQANILIRQDKDIAIFKDVKETYVPAMWCEQVMILDQAEIDEIIFALSVPSIGRIVGIVIACIGVFLVVCIPIYELLQKQCSPTKSNVIVHPTTTNDEKKSASPLLQKKANIQMIPIGENSKSKV